MQSSSPCGATQPGRESGRAPDRDQRHVATNRRSLLRSPSRQRATGHRPRGRRERRGSLDDHRGLRPPRTAPGGRPSPCNDRAQAPAQGYPTWQRAVARRLSQPGPPPCAQPCYGVCPGRAAGVHHPPDPRRGPARRPGSPGPAQSPRVGQRPGTRRGGHTACQASEASPLRPERGVHLRGRRLRRRGWPVLRQFRVAGRCRRQPILGPAQPRLHGRRHHEPASR